MPTGKTAGAQAGAATPAGTLTHAERRGDAHDLGYGPLGRTGLTVCRLGFGGYRVDTETPVHRAALERALGSGVNLIDTSTNYADGGSEELVGQVVGDLVRAGRIERESDRHRLEDRLRPGAEPRPGPGARGPRDGRSPSGAVPGELLALRPPGVSRGPARAVARPSGVSRPSTCACSTTRSTSSRMRRSASEGRSSRSGTSSTGGSLAAFRFFEGEVAGGRLRWYGVSSNTVAQPVDDPEATSLTRMLAAAREAGGPDHHFAVLQLPAESLRVRWGACRGPTRRPGHRRRAGACWSSPRGRGSGSS